MKCPGQDSQNLRVELHKCPKCGYMMEIFSDESGVRCSKCGEVIHREKMSSCIDWCSHAKECLGEERWKQLTGKKSQEV